MQKIKFSDNLCGGGQKKHIFLIQVHKESELLERILNKINAPNHFFAINIDSKSKEFDTLTKVAESFENTIYITNHNVMHGGFSQIECTMDQIRYALSCKDKYDYFHTISGQDYPCVGVNQFDAFFNNNNGKSYMHIDSDEQILEWRYTKYKQRLSHYCFIDDFNGKSFFCNKLFWVLNRFLKLIPRKCDFIDSVCGGWNWFSLHRSVIEYIIAFIDSNEKYYKRFKRTYCGDELIFCTILYPVAEKLNIDIHNSLRFVEWHPKRQCSSTPLILNECEYDDIVKSGAFFCRKCELKESARLLNMLDKVSTGYQVQ